jgi:hypothetical protein
MSLLDDLRDAADALVPSHTVELSKIQGVVSSLVHYLEDPEGFLTALHSDEGAAAGLLAHFTAKADSVNQAAQRDLATASGLTNVPTYQELLDVFKTAIQTGTLPPSEPVAPPTSSTPANVSAPGAPAPAATVVEGQPVAAAGSASSIPGAPPITVTTAPSSPVAETGQPVVPNTSATDVADPATGQPAADPTAPATVSTAAASDPAFTGTPTYDQLMATVQAQQAQLAQTEAALTASQSAAGGGAVSEGNAQTAAQTPPASTGS